MRFKELQALKKRAYEAFAAGTKLDVPDTELQAYDSISLAFVGDAYYSLHMRTRLVHTGIPHVQVLHSLAAELVSAKAQAYVYRQLKNHLDEGEKEVCQRARNANSQAPKSASVAEYHDATALEALVGYLWLADKADRLDAVLDLCMTYTMAYCAEKHGQ